jgi:V/A-type H+/Na+-transporting ATPase subunit I
MIASMVKFSFAVFHTNYEDFLDDIQEIGTVHIKAQKKENFVEEFAGLKREFSDISNSLKEMKKLNAPAGIVESTKDSKELIGEFQNLSIELNQNKQEKEELSVLIQELEPWGNYSSKFVERLEKYGIKTRFLKIKAKEFNDQWLTEYPMEIISQVENNIFLILFGKDDVFLENALEIDLPEFEIHSLNERLAELEEKIKVIEENKDHLAGMAIPVLRNKSKELATSIEFYEVLEMHTLSEGDGKIKILDGWVPKSEQAKLINYLDKKGILYSNQFYSSGEEPPVQLVNGKFAKLFEPIGELFSLPKYAELDLTVYFAPFFMMFFGFCLGDAGYGIAMFTASTIYKLFASKKLKPYLALGQYFGAATFVMGILFGNFFGIELGKVAFLSGFNPLFLDSSKIFMLSLIVGGVQIMFGLGIKAANQIRQKGFLFALGSIGWIVLIINFALFSFIIGENVAGSGPLGIIKKVIYIASALLVLVFTDPSAKIHLRLAGGLWSFYSTITGIFGDLLSYIRLFALGLSSSILGLVVNKMAVAFGEISVIGPVLFVLIIVFGHAGNLAISSLGSFVHPLRLTLVEFYKNAGFSGGGKKYNPFSKYQLYN